MLAPIFILLLIASSSATIHSRSLRNRDQLMPSLLSSDSDTTSYSSNGENRLLHIVGHIIKYVSTIKSSEDFIDNIIDHQKHFLGKLQILKFLDKCFRLTKIIIQHEISRILNVSNTNKESLVLSSVPLKELQQTQHEIDNLLYVIKERMTVLKSWIPPTIPFLGF